MKRYGVDFGPMYAETLPGRFPVEPWNTFSNLLFLLIILFFCWRSRLNYHRYPCTVMSLPLLFVGFVGGTVYHATRSHWIWLVMDFMPIFILAGLGCYFFWRGVLGTPGKAGLALVLSIGITRTGRSLAGVSGMKVISVGYVLLALSILFPAALHCRQRKWEGAALLLLAGMTFIFAVWFRQIDLGLGIVWLPMGTHFLWHIMGGASTGLLLLYIQSSEDQEFERENHPT